MSRWWMKSIAAKDTGRVVKGRLWSTSWCVPCSPQLHSCRLLKWGKILVNQWLAEEIIP